ncbi:MAG: hypothetical protein GX539_13730 [Candidatus Cloacimonetes bacterium]|jgi:hypothetical protein|nr:hypothetical protein [Candidatus Cloacimonadota bacterium]
MEELIPIVMFLCIAAVMILRPLTKRIGLVIEQMARDRQSSRADQKEIARLQAEIDYLSKRLSLVEERADFTERLVGASRRMQPSTNSVSQVDQLGWEERKPSYLP